MKINTHLNPQYSELSEFIDLIPSLFSFGGKVLFEQRNIIKIYPVKGFVLNVKSFKVPNLINKIVYVRFRKSKARRSYENAMEIKKLGISTPDPVAYIETMRYGLFYESYYVSLHEEVDGIMKDIYRQTDRESEKLISQFSLFTANIHEKSIYHNDYSPGNILYKRRGANYQFLLVDLNRITFKNIDIFEGARSFSRIRLPPYTLRKIAGIYAQSRKFDIVLCERLIDKYNRTFWRKYLRRHPEAQERNLVNENK